MRFNFNPYDFHQLRQEAELFYDAIGEIRCPYFKEDIVFNAKGLRHLKFKSDDRARTQEDQYARLKLLYLAPEVLRQSHTVQGILGTKKFEIQNTNSRYEKVMKIVTFYEFVAVLKDVRVKVIVKEVEGGKKHFWSVFPFWRIDRGARKRLLHSGNPDND